MGWHGSAIRFHLPTSTPIAGPYCTHGWGAASETAVVRMASTDLATPWPLLTLDGSRENGLENELVLHQPHGTRQHRTGRYGEVSIRQHRTGRYGEVPTRQHRTGRYGEVSIRQSSSMYFLSCPWVVRGAIVCFARIPDWHVISALMFVNCPSVCNLALGLRSYVLSSDRESYNTIYDSLVLSYQALYPIEQYMYLIFSGFHAVCRSSTCTILHYTVPVKSTSAVLLVFIFTCSSASTCNANLHVNRSTWHVHRIFKLQM